MTSLTSRLARGISDSRSFLWFINLFIRLFVSSLIKLPHSTSSTSATRGSPLDRLDRSLSRLLFDSRRNRRIDMSIFFLARLALRLLSAKWRRSKGGLFRKCRYERGFYWTTVRGNFTYPRLARAGPSPHPHCAFIPALISASRRSLRARGSCSSLNARCGYSREHRGRNWFVSHRVLFAFWPLSRSWQLFFSFLSPRCSSSSPLLVLAKVRRAIGELRS